MTPLLLPYAEDALDEQKRLRVMAHLDHCEACQAELAGIMEMGDFFRANPPTASIPSPGLWTRLEAQIQAEATPVAPVFRPALITPAAQWVSFVRSFAQAGAVVATVLVCFFFVTGRLGVWKKSGDSMVAQAPVASENITILLPHSATKSRTLAQTKPERSLIAARTDHKPLSHSHKALFARTITHKPARTTIVASAARKSVSEPRYVAIAKEAAEHHYDITDTAAAVHQPEEEVADKASLIQPAMWMSDEGENSSVQSPVEAATAMRRQQTLFSYGGR